MSKGLAACTTESHEASAANEALHTPFCLPPLHSCIFAILSWRASVHQALPFDSHPAILEPILHALFHLRRLVNVVFDSSYGLHELHPLAKSPTLHFIHGPEEALRHGLCKRTREQHGALLCSRSSNSVEGRRGGRERETDREDTEQDSRKQKLKLWHNTKRTRE